MHWGRRLIKAKQSSKEEQPIITFAQTQKCASGKAVLLHL